jgi:hypothetical protein
MKKHTFKDWYKGNVTLKYAKSVFINENKPKLVSWDEFIKSDVVKIKEKQKEIFLKTVDSKLKSFQKRFFERYKNSIFKEELLETEKREFADILNGPIPDVDLIVSKNINVLFEREYLLEIQSYFKNTIIGGCDEGFDFIQSPKDNYQVVSKTPSQAYAIVCFKYLEWLFENFKVTDNHSKDPTEFLWFKVGLLFANGEMDSLIEESKDKNIPNFSAISRKLKNMNFRPYISESYYSKNNKKNIFLSKPKVSYLEKYCKENNIPIVESFKAYVKKHK